jgi:NDP-mannose synthase
VDEAIITVGHLAEFIRTFFQDGSKINLKITYSYEECPLGTAGPLSLIQGLSDTFLVSNGDVLTTLDIQQFIAYHRLHHAIATISAHVRHERIDYGVIQTDTNHRIIGYIEKPSYEFYVSMGVYLFEPEVMRYIPHNAYLDLPDLVLKMIDAGEKVMSYPYDGYWMDLGRASDYEQAVDDFSAIGPLILGDEFCYAGIAAAEQPHNRVHANEKY